MFQCLQAATQVSTGYTEEQAHLRMFHGVPVSIAKSHVMLLQECTLTTLQE
jgi:hypothetical protein